MISRCEGYANRSAAVVWEHIGSAVSSLQSDTGVGSVPADFGDRMSWILCMLVLRSDYDTCMSARYCSIKMWRLTTSLSFWRPAVKAKGPGSSSSRSPASWLTHFDPRRAHVTQLVADGVSKIHLTLRRLHSVQFLVPFLSFLCFGVSASDKASIGQDVAFE